MPMYQPTVTLAQIVPALNAKGIDLLQVSRSLDYYSSEQCFSVCSCAILHTESVLTPLFDTLISRSRILLKLFTHSYPLQAALITCWLIKQLVHISQVSIAIRVYQRWHDKFNFARAYAVSPVNGKSYTRIFIPRMPLGTSFTVYGNKRTN